MAGFFSTWRRHGNRSKDLRFGKVLCCSSRFRVLEHLSDCTRRPDATRFCKSDTQARWTCTAPWPRSLTLRISLPHEVLLEQFGIDSAVESSASAHAFLFDGPPQAVVTIDDDEDGYLGTTICFHEVLKRATTWKTPRSDADTHGCDSSSQAGARIRETFQPSVQLPTAERSTVNLEATILRASHLGPFRMDSSNLKLEYTNTDGRTTLSAFFCGNVHQCFHWRHVADPLMMHCGMASVSSTSREVAFDIQPHVVAWRWQSDAAPLEYPREALVLLSWWTHTTCRSTAGSSALQRRAWRAGRLGTAMRRRRSTDPWNRTTLAALFRFALHLHRGDSTTHGRQQKDEAAQLRNNVNVYGAGR